MITYNPEGKPVLTCVCGSTWWVTGTSFCWECNRQLTEEEIKEYEDEVERLSR